MSGTLSPLTADAGSTCVDPFPPPVPGQSTNVTATPQSQFPVFSTTALVEWTSPPPPPPAFFPPKPCPAPILGYGIYAHDLDADAWEWNPVSEPSCYSCDLQTLVSARLHEEKRPSVRGRSIPT